MSDQFKGLSFALLATLGGGLYAIPYRLSLETVAPLTVIWGVFMWALLFSLPGAWLARHQTKYSWKIGGITLLISLAGLLANYSICQALNEASSPTMLTLLQRSEIIITMLLSWLFLKEIITARVWLAVVVIIAGIIVMKLNILGFELNEWSAIIWAITTAFSFAVMQVLAKSIICLLYTSPSPRDKRQSRMPSSA